MCKPGMAFTIEPILTVGRPKEVYWPDEWTNTTSDGKRTAQFGGLNVFLWFGIVANFLFRAYVACHGDGR